MQCPQCRHQNPGGSKFCLECGQAFGRRCTQCGAELPARAKFCNECGAALQVPLGQVPGAGAWMSVADTGQPRPDTRPLTPDPRSYTPKHLAEKILQSRSALEACPEPSRRGERKQVTICFADVKGSMELAEQLDPEQWHTILDRFFQILTAGVHRFEGPVNQYAGDGIMALWGAPIAHEDHAPRACWASPSRCTSASLPASAARARASTVLARGLSKFAGRAKEVSARESALEQALAGHGQVVGVVASRASRSRKSRNPKISTPRWRASRNCPGPPLRMIDRRTVMP